jgi:hypothetical protein
MDRRLIRRTQTITPSGVGAIVDMLGESFVAEDISQWRFRREVLRAPRIAAYFGVPELRTPPSTDDSRSGVPYYRFPQWLFCGACRDMTRWSPRREKPGQPPRCETCQSRAQLVPMRFVAVCGNGHLDDVNWERWAHSRRTTRDQAQCGRSRLRFLHLAGVGGGLESLEVRCTTCKAGRSLRDLTGPEAMRSIGAKCRGRQPWQPPADSVNCDVYPVVLQRGASSVYFPRVESAIDIPPESNWINWGGPSARILNNEYFKLVHADPESRIAEQLIAMVATGEDVSEDEVRAVLIDQLGVGTTPLTVETPGDLRAREWQALTSPAAVHDPRDAFISRQVQFPSPAGHHMLGPFAGELAKHVRAVVLVDRLREIRVLRGFYRHTMNKMVEPDLGKRSGFLPGIEVFGEGVFLQFDEEAVRQWETRTEVRERARILRKRLAGSFHAKWIEDEPTPRLLLIHTLGHLLMRQMSFDAGYSSSSLRERIFVDEDPGSPLAGLLIYTAAGDAEGSLGGLARLGEAERLVPVFARALGAAQWCSLDPVCRESTAQGPDGLSLAACHACVLASETSCILGNVLLDRALVIDPDLGFFSDTVAELLDAQAESLT